MGYGERCVTIDGTLITPTSFVVSWDTRMLCRHLVILDLEKDQLQSGLVRCSVQEMRIPSFSVRIVVGEKLTVGKEMWRVQYAHSLVTTRLASSVVERKVISSLTQIDFRIHESLLACKDK